MSPKGREHRNESNCLRDQIARMLCTSGYPILQYVHVSTEGTAVILRGKVPSFYMKQLVQTAVMQTAGVEQVRNELVVA